MNATEKVAWKDFREVVRTFFGNKKGSNYTSIVNKILDAFKDLCCNMSLKSHYLHFHLDYFPNNLGSLGEEQEERFHKDVKEIERRCQ
jgi:hypothetical protein